MIADESTLPPPVRDEASVGRATRPVRGGIVIFVEHADLGAGHVFPDQTHRRVARARIRGETIERRGRPGAAEHEDVVVGIHGTPACRRHLADVIGHLGGDVLHAVLQRRVCGKKVFHQGKAASEPLGDDVELRLGERGLQLVFRHSHAVTEVVVLGRRGGPEGLLEDEIEPGEPGRGGIDAELRSGEGRVGVARLLTQAGEHLVGCVLGLHLHVREAVGHRGVGEIAPAGELAARDRMAMRAGLRGRAEVLRAHQEERLEGELVIRQVDWIAQRRCDRWCASRAASAATGAADDVAARRDLARCDRARTAEVAIGEHRVVARGNRGEPERQAERCERRPEESSLGQVGLVAASRGGREGAKR